MVIGGIGLIGSKLLALLRQRGEEVLAASPDSGVNTLTGEGLPQRWQAPWDKQIDASLLNVGYVEPAAPHRHHRRIGCHAPHRTF